MVKNGITLLSAHDPITQCRKVANAVTVNDRTLYFCPSPVYGYGLDTLLERLKVCAPNSAVLCVEADPELFELEGNEVTGNREQVTGKIIYTNICEPGKLYALIRETWGIRAFRRVEVLRLTGGWLLHSELYNLLFETLQKQIANDWSNALTLTKLGRLYIRNFLRNLALIRSCKSLSSLSFGDSPVLVLGAGPSADKALDNIPEKRDFKIICVDTCLGSLKDRTITPDLTVILECQHWNMRDFTGCRNWNVPFAFDLSALPASSSVLTGECYLFFTPWTGLSIFERMKKANLLPETLPPLGSVGLTAMEIARRLTTGPITFAGLDFCFTLDQSHARGTPNHREKLNTNNRFGGLLNTSVFREGVIRDGDFYTNPIMKRYRELFEQEFKNKTNSITRRCEGAEDAEKNLNVFIHGEITKLRELRDILTGNKKSSLLPFPHPRCAFSLLNECDYLWSHFPDYAGGVAPNIEDKSFLNRVRIEIDFMLRILQGW